MFLLLPLLFNQHPLGSPDLCVYLLVYTRLCLEIQSPGLMIVLTQKPLLWQMNYCWIATHSSLKYSESKAEEGSWVMDRMYRWEGGSRVMGKAHNWNVKHWSIQVPIVAHLFENHFFGGKGDFGFYDYEEELEILTSEDFWLRVEQTAPKQHHWLSYAWLWLRLSVCHQLLHLWNVDPSFTDLLSGPGEETYVKVLCKLWLSVWCPKGPFQNPQCSFKITTSCYSLQLPSTDSNPEHFLKYTPYQMSQFPHGSSMRNNQLEFD